VLSESIIITKRPYLTAEIKITPPSFDKLSKVLGSNQIKVMETIFNSEIRLKCLIPFEILEKIRVKLAEILKGEVDMIIYDEILFK